MSLLCWPLERNRIRRDMRNHTFGMVRNGGTRAHQGWDLAAAPGTPCYAVADGTIRFADVQGDFGNVVVLEFEHGGRTLFAAYCHLSFAHVGKGKVVRRGDRVGLSGNSGNASTMRGDDQHLHFEIRTAALPGKGLSGRLDPRDVFGCPPMGRTVFEGQAHKRLAQGGELNTADARVRECIE